jgi:hypothetical protein
MLLARLKADVLSTFSRQNVVQNVVALILLSILSLVWPPAVHAATGLTWPWLVPLAIAAFLGAALFALVRKPKQKKAISYDEAQSRASMRIQEGLATAKRLHDASSPREVAAIHSELSAWDAATYSEMEAFTPNWAITFGDNVFEEAPPTDPERLLMLLSAKLARLHTNLDRSYEGLVAEVDQPSHRTLDDPLKALTVKFRYDEEGYLLVGVTNNGSDLAGASINLLAPWRFNGRHLVYRVDRATDAQVTSGNWDETPHPLVSDTPKSLRWTETGLKLVGGDTTTEWKFFMPYVEGDPIYFKIGGDPLGGWTDDLIAHTPATLMGSKATKTFFPDQREATASTDDSGLVITAAIYGVPGKEADVRQRLAELIGDDGVLDFEATLPYLLVDPAPNEFKTLRVRWRHNGKPDASAYHEGTHIVIPREAARQ